MSRRAAVGARRLLRWCFSGQIDRIPANTRTWSSRSASSSPLAPLPVAATTHLPVLAPAPSYPNRTQPTAAPAASSATRDLQASFKGGSLASSPALRVRVCNAWCVCWMHGGGGGGGSRSVRLLVHTSFRGTNGNPGCSLTTRYVHTLASPVCILLSVVRLASAARSCVGGTCVLTRVCVWV